MSNENLGDAITSIVEGVSDEAEAQDETLEVAVEATEEEVVAEQSTESEEVSEEEVSEEEVEGVAEAKVKEEDDEEDEDEVEEVAKPSIPKTKAGVINAAVEMLKKAKKHEAQQLFAKMVAMDESEDDGSVKKAINVVKPEKDKSIKAKSSDASPKQESADWEDDLDVIVANEATLSDGFREKAGAIFEAAYTQKVGAEIDRLESEYAQNLETEVTDVQNEIVEKVDSYLNYVVENWMKENEVAVQQGLRTEIAEEFMSSLQSVFKEHYIEVPEGKADLIDDLADQVSELEEQLNKSTEDNIRLNDKAQSYERADIVRKQSSGLADTEAEKLAGLVEDIDFEDEETFEMKVKTVKESYFKTEPGQSTDESDALVGEDGGAQVSTSDTMSAYTQAISKHNQ
jgi:uncharacterized protein YycO